MAGGGAGRGRKWHHHLAGVPFSGVFIFGTARELVDSLELASRAPAISRRAGKVQGSWAGHCPRMRGRPAATPTPPYQKCLPTFLCDSVFAHARPCRIQTGSP